jgi:hypothetical protein
MTSKYSLWNIILSPLRLSDCTLHGLKRAAQTRISRGLVHGLGKDVYAQFSVLRYPV